MYEQFRAEIAVMLDEVGVNAKDAMKECCLNCKSCISCKVLLNAEWHWFKICNLLASEKDGFAIVVSDNDICECFEAEE